MQPMNSATAAHSSTVWLASPDSAQPEIAWMLNPDVPRCSRAQVSTPKYRMMTPTSRPTSPTRTVRNAFTAARALGSSSHQWPMSMNEHRPMISQPRMIWIMFSASTITQHPGREQRDRGEEVGVPAVAADVVERVDLHEQRDERDEGEQHDGEAVDVLADRELHAPALPPRPAPDDRPDERLAGVVRALDPLHGGTEGEHRAAAIEAIADLGPLHRQALADEDDDEEGDARDERDQPGVLEEPPAPR